MTANSSTRTVGALGALTGLAGGIVYVIGAVLPGSVPKPDAGAGNIATFLADKRDSLLSGFALELIAVGLLLWFIGYLSTVLATASPPQPVLATSMMLAFVATLAIVAAGTIPVLAIVWRGAPLPSATFIRIAYDTETLATYAATSTAAAVSVGAPCLAIWRTGVLPRWLCALGALEIVVNLVELIGLASRRGTFAGGYAGGVGPLLWIVWFAAASACLAWRISHDQRGVDAQPAAKR
jgi:hypothetical protein